MGFRYGESKQPCSWMSHYWMRRKERGKSSHVGLREPEQDDFCSKCLMVRRDVVVPAVIVGRKQKLINIM